MLLSPNEQSKEFYWQNLKSESFNIADYSTLAHGLKYGDGLIKNNIAKEYVPKEEWKNIIGNSDDRGS